MKRRLMTLSASLSTCVVAAAASRTANAALIAHDPFNQGTGPINGTASSSPAVWPTSNNWTSGSANAAVVSGSPGYTAGSDTLQTAGNAAQVTGNNTTAFRALGTTLGSTTTPADVWIGFTFNAGGSANNNGLSLYSGGSGGSEVQFIGVRNGKFGFGDYASAANNVSQTAVNSDGTTHFIAIRYAMAGTSSTDTYYLDPTGLGAGSAPAAAAATITSTASSVKSFTFDTIRLGNFTSASTLNAQVDEIRIGTTWQDVSPVPEPGTLGVLGSGAVGLLWRRRRR